MRMSDNKLKYVFGYVFFRRDHFFWISIQLYSVFILFGFFHFSFSLIYCQCVGGLLLLVFIHYSAIEKVLIQGVFDKLLLDATPAALYNI